MLVLVSFGLVLLATILLVVGLLTDDGLTLIYLSIASSFIAAVVLFLAFRRARPKQDAPSQAPEPLLPDGDEAPAGQGASADATTVQPAVAEPEAERAEEVNPGSTPTADTEPAAAPETETAADVEPAAADDDWTQDDDWADAGEFDVEFPIADYDELTVAEIMPLLPQLYSDELEVVAERERAGKNRSTILSRLADLAATGTEADAHDDDDEPATAPAPAPAPSRPAPQVPSLSDDDWDDGEVFPIADYDELTVDQIVPLLAQLEDDELEDVKAREVAGQGRKSVITEIDRQLGLVDAVGDGDAEDGDGWRQAPAARADQPEVASEPAGRPAPVAASPNSSALAISGYDGLTVAEIRPLLSGLSEDELRAVLDHETARDNRRTIVNEIERRLDSAAAGEPSATPAPAATATKKRAAKKAGARKATTKKATKRAAKKKSSGTRAKKAAAPRFPIADYDSLTVAQIRPRLTDLSDAQLRQVREREVTGAGRKTILNDIDSRLG